MKKITIKKVAKNNRFFTGNNFLVPVLLSGFFIIIAFNFINNGKISSSSAQSSTDAIAIRVMPNPESYSAMRWYKEQGFKGSPQSTTVDGYEAVRDGRTVYVNAANIVDTNADTVPDKLYTNIYLISYNQESESETVDIFGKMLSNWKFNSNIQGKGICSGVNEGFGTDPSCSGTVGCWHFNGNFNDDSGNSNNGTHSSTGETFVTGVYGQAVSFDGDTDYITVPDSPTLDLTTEATIMAWVKPMAQGNYLGSPTDDQYILGKGTWTSNPYRMFIVNSDNSFRFHFRDAGPDQLVASDSIYGYDRNWYHVAVTFDGAANELKIYINGILDYTEPTTLGAFTPNSLPLLIGQSEGRYFNGYVDEVKIYNTELSDPQILSEYNNAFLQCIDDDDCLSGQYCMGPKASVVRDTKRLSELVELREILEDYKNKNGKYPILSAGTYLENISVSTWPSWQNALGGELGVRMPEDYVNKLGECESFYDQDTCWDESTRNFADPTPTDATFDLPAGSKAYVYITDEFGSKYDMCGMMESGYITGMSNGACSGSAALSGAILQQSPQFVDFNLTGVAQTAFDGWIEAKDPQGYQLTWTIDFTTLYNNWVTDGWSAVPVQKAVSAPNQISASAAQAGVMGTYPIRVTIDNGQGGTNTKDFDITITNSPPTVEVSDITYVVNAYIPIDFQFKAYDDASSYPLSYILTPNVSATIPGFSSNFNLINNEYIFSVFGSPDLTNVFNSPDTKNLYTFTIDVDDIYGARNTSSFTITVINNPPTITIPNSCFTDTKVGYPYSCQVEAYDQDKHNLTYAIADEPAGLSINNAGLISGSPSESGNFNIIVTVADEYGFASQKTIPLNISIPCVGQDAISLDTGFVNALVYDTDSSTGNLPAALVAGGEYLKLSNSTPMKTPYVWMTSLGSNSVSKIRAFGGERMDCVGSYPDKHCYFVPGTWEERGQLINVFSVGSIPVGSAVNIETGEVWVVNYGSNNIYKLAIDGSVIKTCPVGNGPRGVAIEKNGDIWVTNSGNGNVQKISGDDNAGNCVLTTVSTGGSPYGIAVDIDNNIWIANNSIGGIQKIDTTTDTLMSFSGFNYIAAPGVRSITADRFRNVWGSRYWGTGLYKVPYGLTAATFYDTGLSQIDISVDSGGDIWVSSISSETITKIDQNGNIVIPPINSGGNNPYGIIGDSEGQVWPMNYSSQNTRVYDLNGNILSINGFDPNAVPGDVYCVNDINVIGDCSDDISGPYAQSDITGLNRNMSLRSGEWSIIIDSGYSSQYWGDASWQEIIDFPNKQSVEVLSRASNDPVFAGVAYVKAGDWNNMSFMDNEKRGRYMEIKVIIKSNEFNNSPVVSNLNLTCQQVTVGGDITKCTFPLVFPCILD